MMPIYYKSSSALSLKQNIACKNNDENNPILQKAIMELAHSRAQYGATHPEVAKAWNALGLIRVHMQRNPQIAKICHEQALRIFTARGMKIEIAITLIDIAYCHEQLRDSEKALEMYYEAYDVLSTNQLVLDNNIHFLSADRAISRLEKELGLVVD